MGARAFAEHVKTVGHAAFFAFTSGDVQSFVNRLPQNELLAQKLYGAKCGGHDGFRAELGHELGRRAVLRIGQEMLAQGNGGVAQARQGRIAGAVKLCAGELISGQGNGCFCIGDAQQGFGQTHQRQAFGAGQRIFAQQRFHGPKRRRILAHGLHPRRGLRGGG